MTAPAPKPTLLSTRLAWAKLTRDAARAVELRCQLLASFTANPLEPYLGMGLERSGCTASVTTGPFDRIVAELVMPASETAAATPDVVVVWPRLEDCWAALPLPLTDALDTYAAPLLEMADAATHAARAWSATVVFVLPSVPDVVPLGVGDAGNPLGIGAAAAAAREAVRRRLADEPGVLIADADEMVRRLGLRAAVDARREAVARIPYTEAAFAEMGAAIARLLLLARRGARKVAVVDADNTLWGGVVGEDGPGGIDLLENGPGSAYRAFQRWLLELRRAGMLVAVASKNNEADLWEAFERSDMVLRREHLAAWRVDWQPKSANLEELAAELNLGTASFVFVDDNPLELAEVGGALPDVALLRMPADPSEWRFDIAASGALDRLRPTSSDMARAESYAVETRRREQRERLDPAQFLASLGLTVDIFPPAVTDLARLAQLVAKTNQFTLDGVRSGEAELAAMAASDTHAVRLVTARDRFGDYGVIGAFVVTGAARDDAADGGGADGGDDGATLDAFVLSCRAMGRGVEEAMLAAAHELAGGPLSVTVHEGRKNQPARTFFAAHGAAAGARATLAPVSWPAHVSRSAGVAPDAAGEEEGP